MLIKDDYLKWNDVKLDLNFREDRELFINIRQIWYISIWANIWNENYWKWFNFKRPILVIKKVWNLFFWVSLTTKWKIWSKFNLLLDSRYFDKENSYINLSQVKTYDKKRFIQHIWTINEIDFNEIKKELKKILF